MAGIWLPQDDFNNVPDQTAAILGPSPPPPPPPIPFDCWPTPDTENPPLAKTIPSYLYVQYNDDDALQAFVKAYNNLTQQFLDIFNGLNLPVYIKQSGDLLDWVAAGLYGFPTRPTLVSGTLPIYGAYNTQAYNTAVYDSYVVGGALVYTPVTDDVFRRIITWHFYKGDGTNFSIDWLKRRIARFLFAGPDCLLPNIGPTPQISITFGPGNIVYINLIETVYQYSDDAIYDTFAYNTSPYSGDSVVFARLTPIALAQVFRDCVNGGFLELPPQFQWIVQIIA